MSGDEYAKPARYGDSFREKEIREISRWVRAGASGSIVGLAGSGKSNLIYILGQDPERLRRYLESYRFSVAIISIDLNNLADDSVATLYRLIMRALFEAKDQFDTALQALISTQYETHKLSVDPFITQNAVRDLLQQCRERNMRLLFLFDQFDTFFDMATPSMTNSLRGLRDSFKEQVCYVVGMRQSLSILQPPNFLGELYELLDMHTVWLGPMSFEDSEQMILVETSVAQKHPNQNEVKEIIRFTGGFPSLIKAACQWWLSLSEPLPFDKWEINLLNWSAIQYRLQEIWNGLEENEKDFLIDIVQGIANQETATLQVRRQLLRKGVCGIDDDRWFIVGELLNRFVETAVTPQDNTLWLDEITGNIFKGKAVIQGMAPLEQSVLEFLLKKPLFRHTKTDIIFNAWPDELREFGVTDDSLYQVVAGLRRKIEPNPSQPTYLVTWRGRPEGGYQLYPGGKMV